MKTTFPATLIDFSGGNTLTLINVTLANLTASDFVFSPFSGDLGISVNKGGTVVLTTADFHAVEPNHPASALTFTVSDPTHGYVALVTDQGHAIASFTEADLEGTTVPPLLTLIPRHRLKLRPGGGSGPRQVDRVAFSVIE